SCLGRTERCPREYRKTQIDGRGIQSVDGILEIDSKGFVDVETSCHSNQTLSKVTVDAPVPSCVGIGQGVASDLRTNAEMVEFGRLSPKTSFDIAQAFAKRQLRECHRQVLIQTSEMLDFVMSTITGDATPKGCQRQMFHQLSKNQLACMHRLPLRRNPSQGDRTPILISNRDQTKI